MLIRLAFLAIVATFVVSGCGKSSDNGNVLQQAADVQQDNLNQDANNTPDLQDEWVAEPTQGQNQQYGQLSQMVVVIRQDGLRYVQLVAGPSVNFQGETYWNVIGESLFDGYSLRTVYVNQNGVRLIIDGDVNNRSALPTANCDVYVQNPNGSRNTVTRFQFKRPKLSPMRQAAYRECREFYPPSLDRLDRGNRNNRWSCQKKVARTTYRDERRWNPWGSD